MCQLRQHICRPFQSAESRRRFLDPRHLQNRLQSHDLGTGGDHTSNQLQPLRARIWRLANVLRTCSLDPFAFPSPTIRESRHARFARQPRLHRQHSRSGHEREPRIHQEGRQSRRRPTAKAASTHRQPNQTARRRGQQLDDSGTQAPRETARSNRRVSTRSCSKPSSRRIRRCSTVWDTLLLIKASSPEADNQTRAARTHTIPTLLVGISGPGQSSPREGQRSGSENGTGNSDLLGPTGTAPAVADLRRGAFLQAGQNVLSRHQENHAERRFSRETALRSRSTQSNRGMAQVRTGSIHSHGTRATSVPGRSAEDVKITVKAFLAEKGMQANSKAWHNAMQSEHVQRVAIAT